MNDRIGDFLDFSSWIVNSCIWNDPLVNLWGVARIKEKKEFFLTKVENIDQKGTSRRYASGGVLVKSKSQQIVLLFLKNIETYPRTIKDVQIRRGQYFLTQKRNPNFLAILELLRRCNYDENGRLPVFQDQTTYDHGINGMKIFVRQWTRLSFGLY